MSAGVDFEDTFSRVEAPLARYSGAHVRITGRMAIVAGQGFEDEFTLDGPPEYELDLYEIGSGSVVGYIDQRPFVVVKDIGCKCNGSRKVAK